MHRRDTSSPPIADPPANIEAEKGVLGSIILDGAVLDDVATILRPDDFYRDSHGLVFRALLAIHAEAIPVDILAVAERLRLDGHFETIGGHGALVEAVESVPHSAHAVYYADIVRQKAISRDLMQAASEILADGASHAFNGGELLERAEARIYAVSDQRQMVEIATAREAINDSVRRLQERDEGTIPGLPTGLSDYDEKTGGLQPGQFIVLAARPSIGKTALALNIAEYVSLEEQVGVLFISLEMVRGELGDRLICGLSGVDSHRFMHSDRLRADDRINIEVAAERLRSARLFIDDAPTRTFSEIQSIGRRHRSREGIGLLILDYLQLIEMERNKDAGSRQEQIAQLSRRFKMMAKDLGIPVLVLSQLNRNAEGREDKRPQMADIRESGAVEQDADVVLLLHRPEYYGEGERPGEADLLIPKNRGGQTGLVKLRFQREITRFSNYSSTADHDRGFV